MQIHAIRGLVKDGELPVRLNPAGKNPFAIVEIGFAEIYLTDTADCDRLIRAAIAAKDLLIEATGAQVRFPASLPPEIADTPEPPDFSDAAAVAIAVDAVAIIAESIRTGRPVITEDDPLGPEACKAHKPDCICWDCEDARAELVAAPVVPEILAARDAEAQQTIEHLSGRSAS